MALIGSLNSGVSALRSFSKGMEVLGDNVANVNTIAFKSSRMDYTTGFGDVLQRSTPSASGGNVGSNSTSSQVGSGVQIGMISVNFAQGPLENTGRVTDLAIVNEGFFKVIDSANNKAYATRAGNLRIDDRGYIVTAKGYRLQGLKQDEDYTLPKYSVTLNSDNGLVYTRVSLGEGPQSEEITNLRVNFNLTINNTGTGLGGTLSVAAEVYVHYTAAEIKTLAPSLDSYTFDTRGNLTYLLSDGVAFSPYQLLLLKFSDKQALQHEGEGLYSGFDAAGVEDFSRSNSEPGTHGLGSVRGSALELSNVDLTQQFANIITIQRSFQSAARIISTSDEILNEITNLKR